MNGISGISSSLYLGSGALGVHSVGMQVTSHNIANVSTAEFEPQRALYATGPNGLGVELDAVIRENMPLGGREQVSQNRGDIGDSGMPPEFAKPSGTELAREFPRMISTQRAFEANTKMVSTADEMLGSLLNIKA